MTLPAHEQIQTYHATIRQKTLIPRTSPETSNHSELCRNDPQVRVLNKSIERPCTITILGMRQTIKTVNNHNENQVKLNYVKHQQTRSNMIPRQVSCNTQISKTVLFFHEHRSQATPLKNNSISNLERNVTQDTRSRMWTHNPGTERRSAHRTTSASLHLFLPQGPEDHLQAQKYQPKIWNINIDPLNHAYTSQRQIQLIMTPTKKTETNHNNPIITAQRLHLRKSSLQEYPNVTQSSNTFQYLNVQPSQGGVTYDFEKCFPVLNILFNLNSTHIIIILTGTGGLASHTVQGGQQWPTAQTAAAAAAYVRFWVRKGKVPG